jgi:hypothetical protein
MAHPCYWYPIVSSKPELGNRTPSSATSSLAFQWEVSEKDKAVSFKAFRIANQTLGILLGSKLDLLR